MSIILVTKAVDYIWLKLECLKLSLTYRKHTWNADLKEPRSSGLRRLRIASREALVVCLAGLPEGLGRKLWQ